jgi:PAS domain S-box-containing protein
MIKQYEKDINETNQYEAFFKHASIGIVVVNKNGEITKANPFLLSLFGYEEGEMIGKKIEILIPGMFHHHHQHHREAYNHNPKNRPMGIGMELYGKKKDGTEFPVEVSLSSYESNGERFSFAFITDNTIRINDKNKIFKLNNDLESSVDNRTKELTRTLKVLELLNERHSIALANQKAILDNAKVMLFAMNAEGLIQFFNPEAIRLTGYDSAEVVKKQNPTFFNNPEDIEVCRQELIDHHQIFTSNAFEVIKQKSLLNEINSLECSFVNKKKEKVPVSLTITPIKNKQNKLIGFMGVAIDISERKKAEINLLEALSKEKKLGELKSRFVSMASHEFRTPLSTILSSAYLIEKYNKSSDQAQRKKHIDRIVSAVNNLTNILNEFLSVGKIEEGKLAQHLSTFNLKEFIENIIKEMKSILKKGQYIHYVHEGKEEILLDNSLFKNIVLNLLSNAIKFSSENSPIHISTSFLNDDFRVQVRDHGIGIPKEDQEHLMDRFFRGTNAVNIQGTGLGLHIVSKYVEQMKGVITYESQINKGTTFNIFFKPSKLYTHENNFID